MCVFSRVSLIFKDFHRYLQVFLNILACIKPRLGKSLLLVDFPRHLQVLIFEHAQITDIMSLQLHLNNIKDKVNDKVYPRNVYQCKK